MFRNTETEQVSEKKKSRCSKKKSGERDLQKE